MTHYNTYCNHSCSGHFACTQSAFGLALDDVIQLQRLTLERLQFPLQCGGVSVFGGGWWWWCSRFRYQLPNTLPPPLPFHAGMSRIMNAEMFVCALITPLWRWAISGLCRFWLSCPLDWFSYWEAHCPPCRALVTQAVCLSLGVPEPPNYPLSPRIVVFGT